eukprot:349804-Chlamydomonas_euryale.AAC.5
MERAIKRASSEAMQSAWWVDVGRVLYSITTHLQGGCFTASQPTCREGALQHHNQLAGQCNASPTMQVSCSGSHDMGHQMWERLDDAGHVGWADDVGCDR